MIQAAIIGCLLLLPFSTTTTKENIHQASELMLNDNGDEDNHSSVEVTLEVWSDADQENKSYTDTSSESIQLFTELFDLLCSQKEDILLTSSGKARFTMGSVVSSCFLE